MPTQKLTMAELVDLALCTPEKGAVNFNVLQALLHGLIRHLGLDGTGIEITLQETDQDSAFSDTSEDEAIGGMSALRSKVIHKITGLKPDKKEKLISNIWKATNYTNRMGGAEEGIGKLSSLMDGIMEESEEQKIEWAKKKKEIDEKTKGLQKGIEEVTTSTKKLKINVEENTTTIAKHSKVLGELEGESKKKKPDAVNPEDFKKLKDKVNELITKEVFKEKVDEIQKQIKAVTAKMPKDDASEVQTALKTLKKNVENCVTKETYEKSTEKQEKTNKGFESQIKELKTKPGKESNVDEINQKIEKQNKKIKELEDKMKKLGKVEGGSGISSDEVDELRKLIADLESKVGAGDVGQLDQLGRQVTALKERLDALSKELDALARRVADLAMGEAPQAPAQEKNAMWEIYAKLKALQEKIEALGQTATNLLKDHASKKQDIMALQKSLNTYGSVEVDTKKLGADFLRRPRMRKPPEDGYQKFSKELEEMLSRLATNELSWMKTIRDITSDVDNTLGQLKLDSLEDKLQDRFTFIMTHIKDLQDPVDRIVENPLEAEAASVLNIPRPPPPLPLPPSQLFLPTFPVPVEELRRKRAKPASTGSESTLKSLRHV